MCGSTGLSIFVPNVYQYTLSTLTHPTNLYPYNAPDQNFCPIEATIKMGIGNGYIGTYPIPISIIRTHMRCRCIPDLGWNVDHLEDWLSTDPILPC